MEEQNVHKKLEDWIGKEELKKDTVTAAPVYGMRSLLDYDDMIVDSGVELPELWHWLYFLPAIRQSRLGEDGHPKRGGFLPPVTLPRRMWVGGSFRFLNSLKVGDMIERKSRIESVKEKEGKSGKLVIVSVMHSIYNKEELALEEIQDIVYREAPGKNSGAPKTDPLPENIDWAETFTPDPVKLFRFSALTFNSHRIHYDYPYAMGDEGYPGLVVHGPFTALLLLEAYKRNANGKKIKSYSFKAVSPLFDTDIITLAGSKSQNDHTTELWAANSERRIAMQSTVTWSE